jgi:hypothetical protein
MISRLDLMQRRRKYYDMAYERYTPMKDTSMGWLL